MCSMYRLFTFCIVVELSFAIKESPPLLSCLFEGRRYFQTSNVPTTTASSVASKRGPGMKSIFFSRGSLSREREPHP